MDTLVCIIPARLGSTRLPRKPLISIDGCPLIVRALRCAQESGVFDKAIVATDSEEIAHTVSVHGGIAVMTSADHASGTDRVFEAARQFGPRFIVNLQGDEPDIPASLLRDFAALVKQEADDNCLITSVTHATIEEIENPNSVKVVLNRRDEAMYFSRAAIPYFRDQTSGPRLKHTGIYGFSMGGLARFCSFDRGVLEEAEKLEQLRALENGMRIKCLVREYRTHGIDTPQDLERFMQHLVQSAHHTNISADK